jgi:hypothetical protein
MVKLATSKAGYEPTEQLLGHVHGVHNGPEHGINGHNRAMTVLEDGKAHVFNNDSVGGVGGEAPRISSDLWIAALLITSQSFTYGYAFSSINPCLATGKADKASDCYHNADGGCPPGSIYNDVSLSTLQA